MSSLIYGDPGAIALSRAFGLPATNEAEIRAIDPDRRVSGMVVTDLATGFLWQFRSESTASAGSTVLVPESGTGRWEQVGSPSASLVAVSTWYVSTSGDDGASGTTSSTPIKTFAELAKRLSSAHYPVLPGAASTAISAIQLIVVNLLSMSYPSTDPLRLRVSLPANTLLAFVGSTSTIASGTFSAITAQNPATNQATQGTDATKTWTTYLKKRVRNTTVGANLDQVAWVAKDLGSNVARLSRPCNAVMPAPANALSGSAPPDRLFQTTVTEGAFSSGDTYVIEDITTLYLGDIDIGSTFQGSATLPVIGFAHISFQQEGNNAAASIRLPSGAVIPNFKGCSFAAAALASAVNQANNFENCCFAGTGAGGGAVNCVRASMFIRGGLATGQVSCRPGSFLSIDNDFMIQGVSGNGVSVIGGTTIMVKACVFDATSAGISQGNSTSNAGGYSDLQIGTRLWGSGNATFGLEQGAGCKCRYNTGAAITITGTSGDFKQAGLATNRSWDEATGLWSSAISPSAWATIANDNAQNVGRQAIICKLA